MTIWMIYDQEGMRRNQDYIAWMQKLASEYGIQVEGVLDVEFKQKLLTNQRPLCVLVRCISPQINFILEEQGIPVFNSYQVSRICNDKYKTHCYIKNLVFSIPSIGFGAADRERVLCANRCNNPLGIASLFQQYYEFSSYENEEKKLLASATDYVIKAVDGHGGKQVFSFNEDADLIRQGIGDRDFVIQPMISTGPVSRDVRVYVIGTGIVAAVMRSSTKDFRSNFSLGGEVEEYELKEEEKAAVMRIVEAFDFGMVGIDFVLDQNGKMICNEIEDVVGARMLYRCRPDLDIAREFLQYLLKEKLDVV